MPTGTLTLPRNMIEAAYSYADKESLSVADLFAKLLHAQYGYVVTMAVDAPAEQPPARRAISPHNREERGVLCSECGNGDKCAAFVLLKAEKRSLLE